MTQTHYQVGQLYCANEATRLSSDSFMISWNCVSPTGNKKGGAKGQRIMNDTEPIRRKLMSKI